MKYAIISAGEGSRLMQEGLSMPKPLVPLNGTPMIERLIRIFIRHGASEIVVIVNNLYPQTREFLERLKGTLPVPLTIVAKTTPSSMHSFHELSPYLRNERFCLTTVDTIFREEEFAQYIETFQHSEADGLMAVTDYIDDEKPLHISTDEKLHITGFHDAPTPECKFISGGIYCLTPKAIDTLEWCMAHGMSRMRNFQRQLVADGLQLQAHPFSKILDVDHITDVEKAERFLQAPHILGISRGNEFSPNHIGNDAAIFQLVCKALREMGAEVQTCTENEFLGMTTVAAPTIFNMARNNQVVKRLQQLEDEGKNVVNSGYGIANCIRQTMTEHLLAAGIPHPETIIMPSAQAYDGRLLPCWIKRGNSHAMVKEDVAYATSTEEAAKILADFQERNIPTAVINQHCQGDLVKFYGVQGTDFFYWFYPDPKSHSKFGLEVINGQAQGFPFDADELKQQADHAAQILNVPIYGGDCVISPNGTFRIIDFNDWPSFARCREQVAPKIAERILHQHTIKSLRQ